MIDAIPNEGEIRQMKSLSLKLLFQKISPSITEITASFLAKISQTAAQEGNKVDLFVKKAEPPAITECKKVRYYKNIPQLH